METKYRHVVFIVASDDREWCFRYISLVSENAHISNMTSVEEDFVLMSSCDHMIMTVGTFGLVGFMVDFTERWNFHVLQVSLHNHKWGKEKICQRRPLST